ncbi:FAD binding domain-containing protein [Humitalea rosea]|nr:FAD binding domain-containing protein [Humitalea rosea]
MRTSPVQPRWHRPTSLEEALRLRAGDPALRVLAGATDLLPAVAGAEAWGRAHPRDWLDISAIPELRGIGWEQDRLRIGATTSWASLRDAALPPWWDAMRAAAARVGGPQVQARGTIGGNLCNASPAADGVPPLLVMDALVECASRGGRRELPLGAFLRGNRATALADDEIMTAILLPRPAAAARSVFLKLGARRHLVISIVMVAAMIEAVDGIIRAAGLAVGACSAVAQRLPGLEAALTGQRLVDAPEIMQSAHLSGLSPIDDIRADAAYRATAALTLLRRAVAA